MKLTKAQWKWLEIAVARRPHCIHPPGNEKHKPSLALQKLGLFDFHGWGWSATAAGERAYIARKYPCWEKSNKQDNND